MQSQALCQVVPVSRPVWRRVLEDTIERFAAWRRRQRGLKELRELAELDHRTLQDIGWPGDMRRPAPDPALRNERW
jgi:uncharacterized protein YjiS (DUF1127 family)